MAIASAMGCISSPSPPCRLPLSPSPRHGSLRAAPICPLRNVQRLFFRPDSYLNLPAARYGQARIFASFLGSSQTPSRRRHSVVCEFMVDVGGSPPLEGEKEKEKEKAVSGSRIRVNGPLKVYHVPKIPEFDLGGHEGEVKDVLRTWKGKPISANLPYKVQFKLDIEGRQVKFFAHLKDGEFEVIS